MRVARSFAILLLLTACFHRGASRSGAAPSELLGNFVDDYGIRYAISASLWHQLPRAQYRVVAWHPAQQYLIAQNDSGNPSDGRRWTRIDWLQLTGMAPYSWAFCLSAYDAPTREAAEAVTIARRETPRTGCNGFPFSRMRRAADSFGVKRPDSPR